MPFQPSIYRFDDFKLDVSQRVLLRDGHREPLPPKAFDLLLALVQRKGEIVDKETVMKEVWPDTFVEDANLGYNVHVLRRTLGAKNGSRSEYIETVPKRGYRFVPSVTEEQDDRDIAKLPASTPEPYGEQRVRAKQRWPYLLVPSLLIVNAACIYILYGKLAQPAGKAAIMSEPVESGSEPGLNPDVSGRLQPVPPPLPVSRGSFERDARGLAAMLVKEQFNEIADRFDPELRGIVTREELEKEWSVLKPQLGSFQGISSINSWKRGKQQVVDLKCEFDAGPRILRVMFNPTGEINGIWMLPPKYPTASEDMKNKARGVVETLLKEDFTVLAAGFDDSMRSSFPPEKLREVWQSTVSRLGPFQRIVQVQAQEHDVVDVKSRFQSGFVYVRVGFDDRNQIRALWVQSSPN